MRWQPWALAAVFAAVFARLSARVRHLFLFGRTRTELVYRVQRLERGIAARRHALSRAAARITALREQRAAARERRDVLKQRERRARSRLGAQVLRLQRVRARLLGRNAALKREARRAPDSRVLAELLPARMAARRSAGADVEASARAVRFAAVSPPYARERACTSEPNAARVVIGSIAWSVPHDRRSPGALADRMINEGWLPLDDILDTREVVGGGVMIDVGANIGTTAILRVVLGDAQVAYAAEPDAANFACLVRNVIDNGLEGRVCPDQVAIGAFDGPTRLRTTTSIGGHHLLPDSSGDVPVACVRLDTWLRRLEVDARDVRFVKIDTQGWEGHVLAGAGELLDCAHIAWALEIAPAMLERASTAPGALYASLASRFGYFIDIRATSGARVQPAAQLPDALAYLANGSSTYTNIVLFGNPAAVANDGRP